MSLSWLGAWACLTSPACGVQKFLINVFVVTVRPSADASVGLSPRVSKVTFQGARRARLVPYE